MKSERHRGTGSRDRGPGGIVGVRHDDRVASQQSEQFELGGPIVLHGPVVIEVITSQVGKDRGLKHQAVEPPLVEAVRRGLHGDPADPAVAEPGERGHELDRPRGGERSRDGRHGLALPVEGAQRSDAAGITFAIQQMTDQPGGGRLAVRASDTYQLHPGGRIAVPRPRQRDCRTAPVVHHHLRHLRLAQSLHHERSGSPGHRVGHEAMAVGLGSAHRDEQTAGTGTPAVGGHPGERWKPGGCGAHQPFAAEGEQQIAGVRHRSFGPTAAYTTTVFPAARESPAAGRVRTARPVPSTRTRKPR